MPRFWLGPRHVAAVLLLIGCATPPRAVPLELDPANPEGEEAPADAPLTPLVSPGPPPASDPKPAADPHAGHDMGAMKAEAPEEHLKGVVTKVAAASLTLKLEKGESVTVLTDSKTSFERGEEKATLKGIQPGDRIAVFASNQDSQWLARSVKLPVSTPAVKNATPAQQFTCPMHPEFRTPNALDRCPKCGMKLKPVEGAK